MRNTLLSYETAGTGHPFLLIHGALVSRRMWRDQIAEFSKTYQVIAPDLPVHGDSPEGTGPYTIARLANTIIHLLDSLKVERAHVCGHSLGGMVAQQLAASRPERVARLVLAETAFSTQSSLWERIQTWMAISFMKVTPYSMLVALSARQYGRIRPGVAMFIKQEMGRYDRKTAIRIMRAALDFDGKRLLRNIMSPTLVLVGEKNKRTHSQAREMAKLIPNAQLVVIPVAHHLLNIDNPEAFNRAVLEFLAAR